MTVNLCIVGAGNISNTRHIPAAKKHRDINIMGVLSNKKDRAESTAKKHNIPHYDQIAEEVQSNIDYLSKTAWFEEIDAVVIGTPPHTHHPIAKAMLLLGKHVLIEKPMAMNAEEANDLIALAKTQGKQLNVMHNFQYASGLRKLEKIIARGDIGEVVSFDEFQLTNKHRRLPEWYNDLPLGLFFDEAPHFMYLLERFGGALDVQNVFAHPSSIEGDNTPLLLTASLKAGQYPAHIFLNFEAPICEWYFVVSGSKKIAFYDLFKDILIVIPTDKEHYALDILKTSGMASLQYWAGFAKNGIKMISGNLLYGHEVVIDHFVQSITANTVTDEAIDGTAGARTVQYMQDIVAAIQVSSK